MLPKRQRANAYEVREALKRGFRVSHAPLQGVFFLRSDGAYRFGVIVSKKTARRAVDRNTLRRRVYAVFQTQRDGIMRSFPCGVTVIVICGRQKEEKMFSIEVLNATITDIVQQAQKRRQR